jgi:MFS family permease
VVTFGLGKPSALAKRSAEAVQYLIGMFTPMNSESGQPKGRHSGRGSHIRSVIIASALGTAFEWYDFFVFGALAETISRKFFSGLSPAAGYLAALALFGAGFGFRPLGAILFGRIGDMVGRKGAFLVTVALMGGTTFLIGALPTYEDIGIAATIGLVVLRCLQGLALGGEYGGAVVYVAEHAPAGRKGAATAWVQSAASLGLLAALGVIFASREFANSMGGAGGFDAWGWRLPFLLSALLFGVSLWIRSGLSESPEFQAMKAEGRLTRRPYADVFGQWRNLRRVLLALVALMFAQGAVWYTVFFYSMSFMEKGLNIASSDTNLLMIVVTAISSVMYVAFGTLSDRVGRKPVMLFGMLLFLGFLLPGFQLMARFGNPSLDTALRRAPVEVTAAARTCHTQLDFLKPADSQSTCDLVRKALIQHGVSFRTVSDGHQTGVVVRVAEEALAIEAGTFVGPQINPALTDYAKRIDRVLRKAGYPDPDSKAAPNLLALVLILSVFAVAAAALYGPLGMALVDYFPAEIRYTALSVPYHVGTGWVGGFLPFCAFAIALHTGNLYGGLVYPAVFTAISLVTTLAFWRDPPRPRALICGPDRDHRNAWQ